MSSPGCTFSQIISKQSQMASDFVLHCLVSHKLLSDNFSRIASYSNQYKRGGDSSVVRAPDS